MGLMIDAYKTAAESFKEQVEPDEKAYKRLLTQRAAVVQRLAASCQSWGPRSLPRLFIRYATNQNPEL